MLASLVDAIMRSGELRNPKSYQVKFIPSDTLMGDFVGEGWYIIATLGHTLGPIATQQEAQELLIAALEQVHGKAFLEDERAKARASWKL